MNLFELFVKIGVDDDGFKKGVSGAKESFGKFSAWTIAKGQLIADGIKAGSRALVGFGKQAIQSYAEYEQLIGGVETLFKGSADKVQEYASNAFRTAGMSANEYMSTVTSFSASLLQSLDGDTEKAAEYANQALVDMSDNANKMGSDMSLIQNAYQGFAKQNYTMLDNLKLGYGGTKTEMERLIADAAKLDSSIKENDLSFGNIVKAIHAVQTEMGITGTTALEAGRTISGSVGAMKSAWSNLITGLADGNADIGKLVDNLVTTIVGDGTEENLGVLGNIMPAVKTALNGAGRLVGEIVPRIVETIPEMIIDILPQIANSAIAIIRSLADTLKKNGKTIAKSVAEVGKIIITGLVDIVPEIISAGIEMIASLAETLADSADEIESGVVAVVDKIIAFLTDGDAISRILEASFTIIQALADGIVEAIPKIADALVELMGKFTSFFSDKERAQDFLKAALDIITRLVDAIAENAGQIVGAAVDLIVALAKFLVDPETLKMLGQAAIDIVMSLGDALVDAAVELWNAAVELAGEILDAIWETDWVQVGKDIVSAIGRGMKNAVFGGGLSGFEDLAKQYVTGGGGVGYADGSYAGYVSTTGGGSSASGSSSGASVVVNQNIYSEAKSAADLMQEAIYYQERAVLLNV